jgi:hypothetical protein
VAAAATAAASSELGTVHRTLGPTTLPEWPLWSAFVDAFRRVMRDTRPSTDLRQSKRGLWQKGERLLHH